MSRTFDLCCHSCKVSLWIGQGWPSKPSNLTDFSLYSTPEHMMELQHFLAAHAGHRLTITDSEITPDDFAEWTEPEPRVTSG